MFNRLKPILTRSIPITTISITGISCVSILSFNKYVPISMKKYFSSDNENYITPFYTSKFIENIDNDKPYGSYVLDTCIYSEPYTTYDILEHFYNNKIYTKNSLKALYHILYKYTPKHCVFLKKHKYNDVYAILKEDAKDFDEHEYLGINARKEKFIDYFVENYQESLASLICKYCSSDTYVIKEPDYNNDKKKIMFDKYINKIYDIDHKKAQKIAYDCLVETISCGNYEMYEHIISNYECLLAEDNVKPLMHKKLFESFMDGCKTPENNEHYLRKIYNKPDSIDDVVKIGVEMAHYILKDYKIIRRESSHSYLLKSYLTNENDKESILQDYIEKMIERLCDFISYNPVEFSQIKSVLELDKLYKTRIINPKHTYKSILINAINRNNFTTFKNIIKGDVKFEYHEAQEIYDTILSHKLKNIPENISQYQYIQIMISNGYNLPDKYKTISDENKKIFKDLFKNTDYFGYTMILLTENGLKIDSVNDLLKLLNK
jgi:hypothetical protein